MRSILMILLCLLCLLAASAQADGGEYFQQEVYFGLGMATSPEEDIFNVPQDGEVGTAPAIDLTYLFYYRENMVLGVQMYGYSQTTDPFSLMLAGGGSIDTTFDLLSFNIGGQWRYLFSTGKVKPFGMVLANWVSGSITAENSDVGELSLSGFSAGGGLGVALGSGRLRVTGLASATFGTASWELTPFPNSSGDEFDPTQYAFELGVSYSWGKTF